MYEVNINLIGETYPINIKITDYYENEDFIKFEWEDGKLYINKKQIISFYVKEIKGEKNGKTKINEKKN